VSGDGLDDANWEILCDAIAAAHRGDTAAAHAATRRLDTDVPVDGQAGTYLWYLLRYRVTEIFGHRPTQEDLRELTAISYPKFSRVIRGDSRLLWNTLRTVFKLAPDEEKVTAGQLVVAGSVALGVLLDDPQAQMDAMRPHLADWWRRSLESFRAQGILEDRSGAERP
jgi:hypothetical protein